MRPFGSDTSTGRCTRGHPTPPGSTRTSCGGWTAPPASAPAAAPPAPPSSGRSGRDTLRARAPASLGGSMATDVETELWGAETRKAVENFPVSGQPIPASVIHWLGRIKAAAARVNADLGLLDADLAERIGAAGDQI